MIVDDTGSDLLSNPCPRFMRITSLWNMSMKERASFHAVVSVGDACIDEQPLEGEEMWDNDE